ncbi:tail tape measure protein [Aurantiacibacter poecillastricola]|uniref:tail tape measure protein n=1 Tax=Aurantiacibacter poecillastricola TaxID=3064385 RepID=UPI00273E3EC1|nr:tail tape measure protein [Aurantiacibacter sp. 219JJ12-13]MDP5260315.1 tail tape measure protein [Aurantiacibacter sp. 219JJ12-13]
MDESIETLMVDVRASTSGFRADIEAMRGALDTSLVDGFSKAGDVLERGLLSAIRRGKLGFDELKDVAFRALGEIGQQAVQSGIANLVGSASSSGGGSSGNSIGSMLGGVFGSLLGLPGRATGGPVAPGAAYLVGERGPEVFVPTSSGRIETGAAPGPARDVRVAINLSAPRGTDAPAMLQRSSRQVASAVARAMRDA